MEKHHYKLLILIFVLIAVFGIIFMKFPTKPTKINLPEASSPPVLVADAQVLETISLESPNGESVLTMKKDKSANGTVYNFFITDSTSGIQSLSYIKIASPGAVLSIPANTFSPDNKYIFLKEEYSGQTDFFVVTKSGTLDISGPFEAKYPELKITDVTGWGGINLIVVNTDKIDGGIGPSFWFEVPNGGFIQLSTRFN